MKKLLSLLLVAALFASALSFGISAADYGGVKGKNTSGVFSYTLINSGKEVRIDLSRTAKGALTIPAKIGGKPVTQIGTEAFYACGDLTSVKIPAGVKVIGAHAFDMCINLKSVSLPSSLTQIGAYAFLFNTSLTSVTVPNKVTSLGKGAFAYCSALKTVTLSSALTSLPAECFEGCDNLTKLTLPTGMKTIPAGTFAGASKLKTLTMTKTVILGKTITLPDYKAVKASAWKGGNTALLKKTSGVTYKAVKAGKTSYTLTDSAGRKLTVTVTVKNPPPTKIAFKKTSVTLKKGKSYNTAVTFTPVNAQTTRTYASKNKKIATVDKNGKITAVAKGKTIIVVTTANQLTAQFTVTVT
ncbi:MAG: leucine-rich repeat protein [Oscillospiraceae bacterium]|jgi:hypothetical protein|nr:leucine-rich repeat protein [Oscillospiraceae bacterium]